MQTGLLVVLIEGGEKDRKYYGGCAGEGATQLWSLLEACHQLKVQNSRTVHVKVVDDMRIIFLRMLSNNKSGLKPECT